MIVRLLLEIEPVQKRCGYHTRVVERDVDLPFQPFVGLRIMAICDSMLVVEKVYWCERNNRLECQVADEATTQDETEKEVDLTAEWYKENGWVDSRGYAADR